MIILVAEDEAVIALVLEIALGGGGHRVLGPAATVEEAVQLAEATTPELALIDINLARGDDGVWLARTLRDRWGIPALFLSGQTGQARAAGSGALGLIGKPYDPDEVLEAVRVVGELLAGRRPGRLPAPLELFRDPGGDMA
jgi:two-component system, response regulator PdtaR